MNASDFSVLTSEIRLDPPKNKASLFQPSSPLFPFFSLSAYLMHSQSLQVYFSSSITTQLKGTRCVSFVLSAVVQVLIGLPRILFNVGNIFYINFVYKKNKKKQLVRISLF